MLPTNRTCPQCKRTINVLRAPKFAGKNYCCSNCAIDAWEAATVKGRLRKRAADIKPPKEQP